METGREQTCVIDIHLSRGMVALLAVALLAVAALGYLAWGQRDAAAAPSRAPTAVGVRRFYLTQARNLHGNQALAACAAGYHMASMWELFDPSNLQYNTDLGYTLDDSGWGPPTAIGGWVRTGYLSSGSGDPGQANCNAWTSGSSMVSGTGASLVTDWWSPSANIDVWYVDVPPCDYNMAVWCVED